MNHTMLTSQEFRRLIAKSGGLWSLADLSRLLQVKARNWVTSDTFPQPAWVTGRLRLYPGWEVWDWLMSKERWSDAEIFRAELEVLARRRFDQEA